MSDETNLTQQEMELLLKIKNNPNFLVERGFDKEKRQKLLEEIKQKANINNQLINDIVQNIEKKFHEINEKSQDIEGDITGIFVNPIEKIAKKINKYVKESVINEDNIQDIKPL